MKIRASETRPKSDGASSRARIATETSTSRRPPTHEPYAHRTPRRGRVPTPGVPAMFPKSASRSAAMTRAPPTSSPGERESAFLHFLARRLRRQLHALDDRERGRVDHPVDQP